MEDPIIVNNDGIKLQPKYMVREELYHCIFENRVFLFYKDNDDILNCYEISDLDIIKEIKKNPKDINKILNSLVKDNKS